MVHSKFSKTLQKIVIQLLLKIFIINSIPKYFSILRLKKTSYLNSVTLSKNDVKHFLGLVNNFTS